MAPDLIPIDPSSDDDARLLAAIDRSWPVPPMPKRMKKPVMATTTPISPGNLIAPIALAPARPRWGVIARIAAVIALVLTGMAAITHESDPEQGVPIFLQAPSPETAGCRLEQRSRDEVRQLVVEARDNFTPPANPPQSLTIPVSVWDLSTDVSPDAQEAIANLSTEMNACWQAGVPLASLEVVNPEWVKQRARYEAPGLSVAEMTDALLLPVTGMLKSGLFFPDFDQLYQNEDGFVFGTNKTAENPWGNAPGWGFATVNGEWMYIGNILLLGPWSSLATGASQPNATTGCPSNTMRTVDQVKTLATRLGAIDATTERSLVTTIDSSSIGSGAVDAQDEDAIRRVIAAYASCLKSGYLPYRFSAATDAFFLAVTSPSDTEAIGVYSRVSTDGLEFVIPNTANQITPLSDGRMLAIISTTMGNAPQSTMLPGIILVKQDGKWLIDQLAIIED